MLYNAIACKVLFIRFGIILNRANININIKCSMENLALFPPFFLLTMQFDFRIQQLHFLAIRDNINIKRRQ